MNPQGEGYYDGISLDPLEVMFIKFKRVLQQNKWGNVMQAGKYHEWLTEQVRALHFIPRVLEAWSVGWPRFNRFSRQLKHLNNCMTAG